MRRAEAILHTALRQLAARCGVLLAPCAWLPAHAQEYPVKPVRMVVATSPGGGTDIAARLISPKLSEYFGRQVVAISSRARRPTATRC